MPKISVIMPAYNAEKYIAEAIDSILGQTFGDFEFIILNDCSKDRTEEIILSYDDPRIVYLKNEQNLGVAATLNRGLAIAKGEYIARMDADDISLPERFEKQVAYLDANDDIVVLGTNLECFNESGTIRTGWSVSDPEQMKVDMLFACGLAHPSVMMRSDVIWNLNGYDPTYNGLEDYELWCRVLEHHKITTLPDILLRYRIHGNQVTQNPSSRYRDLMRQLKIRQIQQLSIEPDLAGAFFLFCEEGKPDTAEKIKALDEFFVLADNANAEKQLYNSKKLRISFRSVILSSVSTLPQSEQWKVISKCKFARRYDLLYLHAKQLLKYFIHSARSVRVL